MCAAEQFHQWTDEHMTTRKTGSVRWKNHHDRFRLRRYVGERCLPECSIGRHSVRTLGVMIYRADFVSGVISAAMN
ncbi:hypothetical protein TNCV_5129191 [Trichonephila clavipes]|nr:hypothetical protein TNCV_5129191 [Trichonephila clavipes]